MATHLVIGEVAAIAGQLTAGQWAAIQEAFAAVGLTKRQRDDWAAIQADLAANLDAWQRVNDVPYFGPADFYQLLWSHCRLLARSNAMLLGVAELLAEQIDEDAINLFRMFVWLSNCDSESPTLH
jgi:hypothetical protein